MKNYDEKSTQSKMRSMVMTIIVLMIAAENILLFVFYEVRK
jgi:hypothetical protein